MTAADATLVDARPAADGRPPLIEVAGLSASYGRVAALKPVDLRVGEGEFVTVLGPNGAGKTTLLRAIARLVPGAGRISFRGQDISALPTHKVARLGIVMVQEGRGLFGEMTVRENLLLGAYGLGGAGEEIERRFATVFELFPKLRLRADQIAASMSGGEQQMLAVGRALMAGPQLLMLDEPSLGLAPRVASGILDTLGELNRNGLGILLVEQKAPLALKLAKRVYVLASGSVRAELPADQIGSHHDLARYYFH
ncbi:ABC transporter ATP-binding protein [Rhodoplanes elegans]|uniref:ABC transporter ATP-binding protein n=1 Tax=Rhodoplanes elegans TaxID=29408 RepID=A0A327KJT7_9BRAD|nr:ABC transporter ATP-binding protein [Rhodoplanes elegans]MBK5958687.1 ABC transporter ATP-binding protein [Rhodoplanes elegans]RAI38757.1 ABC transporter ATP-binding protein [Rhodoplanes elegans]